MKILSIIVFGLTMQIARAQSFNPNLAAMLQDTLDTYVASISNIKGMSASVYLPGQGLWTGSSGLSYAGQPITTDMKFGIASNSKLFVSTAMLILAESNTISLDDSVKKWLPSYPNVNPDITIRQLLNHTSGVSDPIFQVPWIDTIKANPTRIFTPEEVLSWLGAPFFAPGAGYTYSNVNYILAGMIAESATGFHISKIIRDSIFTPLDMDSTFYDFEEAELATIAHRWWDGVDFNDTSRVGLNSAGGCAGAIFSTASEMAQWYHALFSGKVVNQASMTELTTFGETSNPLMDYGLGLTRETIQGRTFWGHGGATWGYRSKMIYDTCMGAAVCGLTNSFPSGMDAVTFLLYRAVVNHIPGCSEAITGTAVVCQGEKSITYTVPPIANATSYLWTLPSGATGVSITNTITLDYDLTAVSGNIRVSGVNDYGAGGTSDLWITVNPIPATPSISQNGNLLTSSAPDGNQWYNSAGILVGETNQNYTITATDAYYTIVNLAGCTSDTSDIMQAVLVGMEEHNAASAVRLYPNPVSDELIIELEGNTTTSDIEILNAMGQLIFKGALREKTIVRTDTFAPGVYLIKIETASGLIFKKVIKK